MIYQTVLEAAKNKKFGKVRKPKNYFLEYDFNFTPYRNRHVKVLEIGVQAGGSLAMWQQYFTNSEITGLDIDPACSQFERDNIKIYIGSQENQNLLKTIDRDRGPFDIIIDDGGHTMRQQIETCNTLFPLVAEGGVYVIEDTQTSYWHEFGGAKGRQYTAVGFLKSLIDSMHYEAIQSPRVSIFYRAWNKVRPFQPAPRNDFEKSLRAVYIADGIAFLKKEMRRTHEILKF